MQRAQGYKQIETENKHGEKAGNLSIFLYQYLEKHQQATYNQKHEG